MRSLLIRGRLLLMLVLALALALPAVVAAQSQPLVKAGDERPTMKPRAGQEAVPGEAIVKYGEAAGPAAQTDIRRQEGLEKKSDLGLIHADLVKVKGRSTEAAIRDLNNRPDVAYAEPNYEVRATGYSDEPLFPRLWGLDNTGQAIGGQAGVSNVDINGPQAAARTQGGANLTVAVIDDGVDFSHPDLAGHAWKNPGESGNGKETDGIDNDGNGLVDDVNGWDFHDNDNTVTDANGEGHGTHVSGTIAASINNTGVVGVAPNVKIMALRFLGDNGSGSSADAIKAIQYAKSKGVRISNNSWGGGGYSQALKDAIDASGSLFVAAAGNGGADGVGDDNDLNPSYPASYTSPNILSVAAVDNTGKLASFSNYGATSVDISAPGVGILSSVPARPSVPAAALSSVGVSGQALTTGFGAEEIGASAGQTSFFGQAFQAVGRGSQPVVLVDDDCSDTGDPDVGTTLSTAIEASTGSAPQRIQVPCGSDGPALSQLSGKTVVWATGQAFAPSGDLTATDQATLTTFLDGGGKLVLAGMDALYGIETSTFVTSTLNLSVTSDVGGLTFVGASGTPFAGASYDLNSAFAYNTGFHDKIVPANAAAATQGSYAEIPASWQSWNGTSMATPHVTGTAALVASKYPGLLSQPGQIKQIIMNSGKKLSATAGKTVTGDMVNAQTALFPRVTAVSPAAGKTGILRGANVVAVFSDAMNANTIDGTTFRLVKSGTTTAVKAAVTYDSARKKATLNPGSSLAPNTYYTATVKGGATGVKNSLGDPMFASKVWKFKTGS